MLRSVVSLQLIAAGSFTSAACGGADPDATSSGSSTGNSADGTAAATSPGMTGPATAAETAAPDDSVGPIDDFPGLDPDVPATIELDCRDTPPAGAQEAPPLPTYEGTCPALVPGLNPIDSMGNLREFLLIVPADVEPDEELPVIFLWHWLGGSAQDFLEEGDVQNAVDEFRFIAVIPEEKGDLPFRWPITVLDPAPRFEEEFQFFDDMLACVAEQYVVEPNCVSSAGVSAGGLFMPHLATGRGQHLASFLSLSGGTGGTVIPDWAGSVHAMPAMVLWGGEADFCIAIDFNNTSQNMEQGLTDDGHFILECVHNCMHAAPPFDAADGETAFAPMWRFFLSHPYWLEDGDSPYLEGGVPADMPDWCGVGMGGATPREGECGGSQC